MLFATPYYLLALLGIMVPIAIHLWNRKKGRIIKVGSIKLLAESDTYKMSSIKISEWLLMFLRIALIALLALLLSGLYQWSDATANHSITVLVDRDYLDHPDMEQIIDSMDDSYDLKLFENNFPSIQDQVFDEVKPDKWSLTDQLGMLHSDSIVIYAPLNIRNFQGRFETLPPYVSWISLPQNPNIPFVNSATWQSEDSILLVLGITNDDFLKYEKLVVSRNQPNVLGREFNIDVVDSSLWFSDTPENVVLISDKPTYKIGIYASKDYEQDVKYVEAGFETLSRYINAEFEINDYQKEMQYDMVVWLADDAYEKIESEIVLKLIEGGERNELVSNTDSGIYELAERINPYFSQESTLLAFPEALLFIVNNELLQSKDSYINDQRLLDVRQLYGKSSPLNNSFSNESEKQLMDQWIWIVFLLLFLTERSVSLIKNS